jgi:glycosyltransferase involved in cell wall biosynthesis
VRILHVVGKLDRGGAETWLVQTLKHIDRSKYQFDFLVHTEEPGAYDDEVRALGSRIIPCLKPANPVKYARNFLRVLKEHGPYDCVHSHVHHFSGYVMALAAMGHIPMRIAHSHTAHRESTAPVKRKAYLRSMEMLVRAFATNGIAVGIEAGNSLFPKDWRSDSKWLLQPIGIDLEQFQVKRDRKEIRKALGIKDGAILVGHVGRFVEAKNHSFFVEVAEELVRSRESVQFLLVGEGPLREKVARMVDARGLLGQFIFTGIRSDVPDLLDAMDIFLFPSLYEGLPLALLEAQAAKLPCVASTGVTPDADAGLGLLTRLALSEGKTAWADAVWRVIPDRNIERGGGHRYSIQDSVALLVRLYAEPSRQSENAKTAVQLSVTDMREA